MIAEAAVALALLAPAQQQPCQTNACEARVQRRHMRRVVEPHLAWLRRTAACESGGRWHLNTHNGFFGGLQFSLKSWRYVGGKGYPHLASELEQEYRAVRLLAVQGRGAWPNCG
jgi:hypothetical protein